MYLDTCICSLLSCVEEVVVHRIEGHGKGTVHNPAIHVDTEINLHHITLLQHDVLLPRIGREVSHDIVQRQARGKAQSGDQAGSRLLALISKESSHAIVNANSDLSERPSRLCKILDPVSDLAMRLRRLSIVFQQLRILQVASLLSHLSLRGSGRVVLHELPLRENTTNEQLIQGNARGRSLIGSGSRLLFLLSSLALLLLGSVNTDCIVQRHGYGCRVAVGVSIIAVAPVAETAVIVKGMLCATGETAGAGSFEGLGRVICGTLE